MTEQDLMNKVQRTRLGIELDLLLELETELELEACFGGKTESIVRQMVHDRREQLHEITN